MKELLKSGRESTPIGIIDEGGYEHNNRVYSWGGHFTMYLFQGIQRSNKGFGL